MVAKAMAKQDVSAADKALIDKLAAEFATELDSLGVRVVNLERNADKVKFTGKLRWQYDSERYKHNHPWNKAADKTTYRDDSNGNYVMFRLTPTAQINDHWQVRARIDAKDFTNSDSTGTPTLKRAWVVGNYGNTRIQIGKFHPYVDTELIMDNVISGAQVSFGSKVFKTIATAGRFDLYNAWPYMYTLAKESPNDNVSNYQSLSFDYNNQKNLELTATYHHYNSSLFNSDRFGYKNAGDTSFVDDANIFCFWGDYRFAKQWGVTAGYAVNTEAAITISPTRCCLATAIITAGITRMLVPGEHTSPIATSARMSRCPRRTRSMPVSTAGSTACMSRRCATSRLRSCTSAARISCITNAPASSGLALRCSSDASALSRICDNMPILL